MHKLKQLYLFAVSGIILIFIFAWFFHGIFLPGGDVSWDLLASQRLAAGGTYTHDFFDLNPPLILYLYLPAVFLAEAVSMSPLLVLKSYVFGLALFSLVVCSFFIRRIFLKEHVLLSSAFFVMLAALFLILPAADMGQREHLCVIFTLPYFLAVSYRLQGNTLNRWYAIGIGLFSVLGFALKPYFLVPLVFVELYTLFYTRNVLVWLREELVTILVFLAAYLAFIFIFHSDYIFTIVPVAMRYYYLGFKHPWNTIAANFLVYFCGIAALFHCILLKNNPYRTLSTVLFLAMTGYLVSYAMQQISWFYHLLPAVSIACLLITLLFGLFIKEHQENIVLVALSAALCFSIPLAYINMQYSKGINFKKSQQPLIAFLHTEALHQPVYFISAGVNELFPAVVRADAIYSSRFLHLFWMPGVVKSTLIKSKSIFSQQHTRDEGLLINMIAEDIETKKPKFVLVDVREHKPSYLSLTFEYLPYLLKARSFQAAWKPYHYLTTLEATRPMARVKNTWDLYLAQSIHQISPNKMNRDAVILTGIGASKIAYYVHEHHFITYNNSLRVHTQVELTEQELLRLTQQDGKVNKNRGNERLITQLVHRAVDFPAYKYQIYQREDTPLTGIS